MADGELASLLTNPDTGAPNRFQAEQLYKILQLGLLGGGVGLGFGALRGLSNLMSRNLSPPPKIPIHQSAVPIPVPVPDQEEQGTGPEKRCCGAKRPGL